MNQESCKMDKAIAKRRPRLFSVRGQCGRLPAFLGLLAGGLILGTLALTYPAAAQFMPGTPGHLNYTTNPLEPGPVSQSVQIQAPPMEPQNPPNVMVAPDLQRELQHTPWPQNIMSHQWTLTGALPGESIFSHNYLRTSDPNTRKLTLKEAIYIALRNNPSVIAASMDPVLSLQAVRQSWAVFDPNLTSQADTNKNVTPVTNPFTAGGLPSLETKNYDWDFGISKVSALTNGTMGITFDNNYNNTNSLLTSINNYYTPLLEMSVNQPLLRNFGNEFATINVRIAQTNQRQAQYTYEQQLNDFVLRVGTDYWNLARAEMNLEVAKQALAVDEDLVRQNAISVNVGVMAPLQLKEAQSQAATDQANVYTAQGALETARAVLRQDVMYNPTQSFMPAQLEVADRPHPNEIPVNEERSLELAMMWRPELAALRQEIESLLLQVKYAENQTLPQFNVGAEFGITASGGDVVCGPPVVAGLNVVGGVPCIQTGGSKGVALPYKGGYNTALNRLFRFTWYNYAVTFDFERPLSNDAAKAALAQAKTTYEQGRMNYRNEVSEVVVDVQQSLAGQTANYKAAQAAHVATATAAAALHDERETFRVGMATTHDLLQYIESLVAAEGNEVQAQVNFEISKLQVQHAQGTLLREFNINFVANNPNVKPWYAQF
jgi:outer membrane protein